MSNETKPRLLLIEDDTELGPIIADVLGESYDVELIADGQRGLEAVLRADTDVVIIDRRLPGLDGTEVVSRSRSARVTTPMLMLTALSTTADKVEGLDSGANDYLIKPFEFDELFARLRALTRVIDPRGDALPVGEWTLYPDDGCIVSPHIGPVMLTPKECALLRLLAENPDRTFTRHQILRAVFRAEEQPGTVDTYVHYLRRKTDRDVVLTVRGKGYRLGRL
ncbi:MAG TPA: response regulator transcription factor [Humibacter sp.]|nr:response regulator transcription factor [Humibacter sp.]